MPLRIGFLLACFVVSLSTNPAFAWAESDETRETFFEKHVRPLLAQHCFECHGPKKQHAGLRLDGRKFLLAGNENGPAVVAGKPDESRLIDVVKYVEGDIQMPPAGKLANEDLATLEKWIQTGAFWPESAKVPETAPPDANAWKQHWAFQPIQRPALPEVARDNWGKTPVDDFILDRLEEHELLPAPEADRATWLRRVTFDLTGLPPTTAEMQAFLADDSATAWDSVVNRLLASPRYGERWGRYWLDVARYADTKGYVFREERKYPESHTYRDWVIQAFNSDMPFDRFLKYQIAADQFVEESNQHELAAMGFLTLGRRFLNNRHDIIDDRIDVTTRGLMGLTVSCARCHDHKYDPIPAADYYSLYGVFASSEEPKNAPSPLRLVDSQKPFNPYVFLRGSPHNRGPQVPRQFLLCVAGEDREPFQDGSGRKELAEAIASPDNPLTARVFVNRVWGHYFGKHLVDTPSDFGVRSTPPTHPELLDWLAQELIDQGWSLKHLHRMIALSATYRQTSALAAPRKQDGTLASENLDPENTLYWRMNRRRLDFEALRDATLAASGNLNLQMGGPSVTIESPPFSNRRTVYSFIDRQNLPGVFRTFDFASPDTHNPKRYETTVPQQGLFLMNSPFLLEQAMKLAARSQSQSTNTAERITNLYQLCLTRDPSPEELALGRAFVERENTGEKAIANNNPWNYGYGEFDAATGRVTAFQPLPHWTGSAWQGGGKLPDANLGWATLNATGGHPGDKFAVVRRWTAPEEGTVIIRGELKHSNNQGDGVRGTVFSSSGGQVGQWSAHNSQTRTDLKPLQVKAGDTLDFITDCQGNTAFDSFHWTVSLELQTPGSRITSKSNENFEGPGPRPLNVWEQYAQVLLLSNEFAFID